MRVLVVFIWFVLGAGAEPLYWGERVPGVVTHFVAKGKEIALTFDACGGSSKSSGYDDKLIDYLRHHKIKATLFINSRWIDANPALFLELAKNPFFEIENHGTRHKPLSVTGRSAYGIEGTRSLAEVRDEVKGNHEKVQHLTGRAMRFFRSGTAYYDEVAVADVASLGYKIAGFSVVGDAGATLKASEVKRRLLAVKRGDIVIAHMNHPESETAEGVIAALEQMQQEGWSFVRLDEIDQFK